MAYAPISSRGENLRVGDYVIADHAKFDDFTGETYVINQFKLNLCGELLVQVSNIRDSASRTVFYPYELSHENWTV